MDKGMVLKLAAGRSAPVYLERGVRLVASGELTIRRWEWLAEQMLERRVVLADGEAFQTGEGGWAVLEARYGAELRQLPARHVARAELRRWFVWMRALFG